MRERNVKVSDVKTAVLDPEHQETVFGNKILAARKFSNSKILEVIYFKKGNNFVIITAYWL
jgi:hypothetical protein